MIIETKYKGHSVGKEYIKLIDPFQTLSFCVGIKVGGLKGDEGWEGVQVRLDGPSPAVLFKL